MKLLKQVLRGSISVSIFATLALALTSQWVRDVSLFWTLSLYIPLLPLGLIAILWDVGWRGRSFLFPYSLALFGLIAASIQTTHLLRLHISQPIPQYAQPIRLLHWNVLWGGELPFTDRPYMGSWDGIRQTILDQKADIIVLSEPPKDKGRLPELVNTLGWNQVNFQPVKTCRYCRVLFSVLSPYPMKLERYSNPRNGNGFIIRIDMPQGVFRLLVVDGMSKYTQSRLPFLNDTHQTVLEQYEKQQPIDVIAGDFNAIRRSRGFDPYPEMAGGYWLASDKTWGWRATWRRYVQLFDIDHVWVSQRYTPIYTKFLFDKASDHRGQLVTFYPKE